MRYLTFIITFIIFIGCQPLPKRDELFDKNKCHIFSEPMIDMYTTLVLFPNRKFLEYSGETWSSPIPYVIDRGSWFTDNKHLILTRANQGKETMTFFQCEGEEYLLKLEGSDEEIPPDVSWCDFTLLAYKKLENDKICERIEETPIYLEACEECRK
jgi:hypothetical protein